MTEKWWAKTGNKLGNWKTKYYKLKICFSFPSVSFTILTFNQMEKMLETQIKPLTGFLAQVG